MKKVVIGIIIVFGLLFFVALPLMRISPFHLDDALEVASGMGAKLACSGRYVMGQNEQQVIDDLATYSPATKALDIQYDDDQKRVVASMLGLSSTTAQYRDGIGCTLEFGDTTALNSVHRPEWSASAGTWPLGSRADNIDQDIQKALDEQLRQDNIDGYQSRALLVVKDGKLVAESYAPEFDETTAFLGWSMGKSITSILLGRLDAMEPLDVSADHLFSSWQNDDRAGITLESLLQMSSGLGFSELYAPGSDATRMLFTEGNASSVAMESPLEEAVGTHFSYSSGTTNLLARYLFDKLGGDPQSNIDFFYREVAKPLGMSHTVFEPDASGAFVGSSYIYASARDWARLGQLMLGKGEINGQRLLTEDWVTRASQPNHSDDPRYGYQFWLNGGGDELRWDKLPSDAYAMMGNRSQVVMIIPSQNAVIVRLGWTSGYYPTNEVLGSLTQKL
ncbi:class C beta-lactamase-related serine hydrolase [Alteromonadaceae bacterium M269]|nr:class C beta-lactamase-related serine hydrolase [Alteromonadaceae bacterium M269]